MIASPIIKQREKRKWQIAMRRYVIEKNPSLPYAPYFGIDIGNFRKWIEIQLSNDLNWNDFAKKWQFDHVMPVTYFDFSRENELRLCWNFINIRAIRLDKKTNSKTDVFAAKIYFEELYRKTGYGPCLELLDKINRIELSEKINTNRLEEFIITHKNYLDMISSYTPFEFENLNTRSSSGIITAVDSIK